MQNGENRARLTPAVVFLGVFPTKKKKNSNKMGVAEISHGVDTMISGTAGVFFKKKQQQMLLTIFMVL